MVGKNGNQESTVKGLSTEKKEEPHCPDCNSTKLVSRGMAWICKECGRYFVKEWRGKFRKDLSERPKRCPHCGFNGFILANGLRWWCPSCKKSWIKSKGKFQKRQDMGERPICPYCGTPSPASGGDRWICVSSNCRRSWKKNNVNPSLSPAELFNAKIMRV